MKQKQKNNNNKRKNQAESNFDKLIRYLSASWHPYALIILTGILVFGRTVWFNYTYFDDNLIILKNINSLTHISGILNSFSTLYFGPYYRPVITISLTLDAMVSGVSPWMYHLSNLIFHLTAGCLTYFLLVKLIKSKLPALMAGIVFILHPLAVQSVAWIPGRNDSLLAVFIIFSFIFFLYSLSSDKYYFYILHILFFYAALFTKESALIFPLIILSYYIFIEKASLFSAKTFKYAFGWTAGIILWYFLRSSALSAIKIDASTFSPDGFFSNFPAILEMFGKLIFPFRLSVYPTIHPVSIILGIIALLSLVIFLIAKRKSLNHILLFSLCWILLFSLPSLIVNIADSQNRFSYLESRGYITIAGFAIFLAIMFDQITVQSVKKKILIITPFILLYGTAAFIYSSSYRNPLAHWEKAVEMSPGVADTYYNLGIVSAQIYNNLEMSENNFKKAIELYGANPSYHNWLGVIYGEKKMPDSASNEFNTAITLNPKDPAPYSNLGFQNYLDGNYVIAEKYFQKSLSIDSTFSGAYYRLIDLYCIEKRYNDALKLVADLRTKGIKLNPNLEDQIRAKQK